MNFETRPDRAVLAELLLEWEELYECGQDTPARELAKDHPKLIPELARRINALKTVSWITRPTDRTRQADSVTSVIMAGKALGGRYRLERLIAEGGFAEVYRAYDTELQRTVAVKIPKRSRLQASEVFLAEARRVAKLKHDGIVPVYDVGVENDTCFIVSEFLEGGSLADRLVSGRPSRDQVIRWISEVTDALQYAHEQGIVHRDVKPANILIDQHERAKLADFGIAQSSTKTGELAPSLGTLRYMSPEQLEGNTPDHRSDIYNLGLILHEALAGQLPYSSLEPSVIRREIMEGRVTLSSSISSPLVACIRKATSRSPNMRHASAGAFASELRRVAGTRSGFATSLGWALAFAGFILVGLLAIEKWQQPQGDQTEAAKRGPFTAKTLQAKPKRRDGITLSGFGSEEFLTGSVPPSWIGNEVFAEINTPGTAEFPRVPESAYVMEADLVISKHTGRIAMFMGEPKSNVEICMGDLWDRDKQQDKIATRLFRGQPFGVNWSGEVHLESNQKFSLMLVVADDDQVLFRNGQEVLRARGEPTDFCLRLDARIGAQATFQRLSCRALTAEDARRANVEFPLRTLRCDAESARKRVKSQIPDNWPRKPVREKDFVLGADLAMRWIAPAEFTMGFLNAPSLQFGQGAERVRFSQGYWVSAYEVTQGQWQDLMGDNPSRVIGSPLLPVNQISWSDARRFCSRLTEREQKANNLPTGYEYRLPTEAEWEYASRAGTDREYVVPRNELAYRGGKHPHIVEVGSTPANPWGLYEVLGNVAEWCLDQWHEYPENQESPTVDRFHEGDPSHAMFMVRGHGFWYTDLPPTVFARAPRHDIAGNFRGFRIVLGPKITLRFDRDNQKSGD